LLLKLAEKDRAAGDVARVVAYNFVSSLKK